MAKLYSYVIPYDDGAAPNPHFGYCTLNICKPVIRRSAQVGDWVVGTGSADSPIGDCRNKVVYAMRVDEVIPMSQYDQWANNNCPEKIVDWNNGDFRIRLGDSIYDFSKEDDGHKLRPSVHTGGNVEIDLGGKNTLISQHFYYFGNSPIDLPDYLLDIVKKGQGHKSTSITHLLDPFINWIEGLNKERNTLHGKHQMQIFDDQYERFEGGCIRTACGMEDEKISNDSECC